MEHARDQLRAWLDRCHMTQRKLAELIQVHEVYVGQLLKGDRRMPGLLTALRIENVTGIPMRAWGSPEPSRVRRTDRPAIAVPGKRR